MSDDKGAARRGLGGDRRGDHRVAADRGDPDLRCAQCIGSRIVRQGLLADPKSCPTRSMRFATRNMRRSSTANRAAIETPFASSWKGAAKPEVTLVEFFDYACPYCKASNPHVDRLLKEDKGLRVVYRELPILGPDSVTSARLSLEASKLGRFAQFHDALVGRGPPVAGDQCRRGANRRHRADAEKRPGDRGRAQAQFALAGQLGATGTPLFVIGDRVMNGAVGYDALKQAIEAARKKAEASGPKKRTALAALESIPRSDRATPIAVQRRGRRP